MSELDLSALVEGKLNTGYGNSLDMERDLTALLSEFKRAREENERISKRGREQHDIILEWGRANRKLEFDLASAQQEAEGLKYGRACAEKRVEAEVQLRSAAESSMGRKILELSKWAEELVRTMGRIQDKSQPYPDAEVDCEQVLDEISQLATNALKTKEDTK